ncbi:MAG: DUF222 domain-containing protein [Ilumatobacteraceae bacterium]|nr:DUF222 domain-containing protein [Ilumatobacteraceae bacterium]
MSSADIANVVGQLSAVDVSADDVECCTRVLHDLSHLIAWAEAGKVSVASRLTGLAAASPAIFPEHVLADATRVSLGQALQPFKRAAAIETMPSFGTALADGEVSVAHVDVIAAAIGKLEPAERDQFAGRGEFLTAIAERSTPAEFARTVRTEMLRLQRGDGLEVLRRQKQATYLKTWVDKTTGMWCLHGEFDPETGGRLHGRLTRTIEKLFHDSTPDTAPRDALDKQHHLRALSLAALIDGDGAKAGGVDMSILIDAITLAYGPHEDSVIDCGLGIDLPLETIRRMACLAEITPIIVGADGVKLHLGNTTRLANREQRRALRAMYRGCAVPGCCVAWDYVVIHHLKYFRNGGPTDIENLLPLCTKHHHYAHEGGWQFRLSADRTLTITLPDGNTQCHSPPRAFAA